jgi:hypothetical protein
MKIQKLLKSGIIVGLIASAANVILYLISKSLGIISDSILLPNGAPLLLFPVVISSVLPGVVAGFVLWVISKISKNPVKIFTLAGVGFLLISMIGPVATPNLTIGFKIVLSLMHLIAGGFIIYFLRRSFISYKNDPSK